MIRSQRLKITFCNTIISIMLFYTYALQIFGFNRKLSFDEVLKEIVFFTLKIKARQLVATNRRVPLNSYVVKMKENMCCVLYACF